MLFHKHQEGLLQRQEELFKSPEGLFKYPEVQQLLEEAVQQPQPGVPGEELLGNQNLINHRQLCNSLLITWLLMANKLRINRINNSNKCKDHNYNHSSCNNNN